MNLISQLETDLVCLGALSTGGLYENHNTAEPVCPHDNSALEMMKARNGKAEINTSVISVPSLCCDEMREEN